MKLTIRASGSMCPLLQIPRSWGLMRPSGSTAVASVSTSPAPPTARLPRCTKCQSFAYPSVLEYSHMGETKTRFANVRSRMEMGSNRWAMPLHYITRWAVFSCSNAVREGRSREIGVRGEANRDILVVLRRRAGDCDGAGSQIGCAQFLARLASAQPLLLHADVCSVPGVEDEPSPELHGMLEADLFGVRHDPHRGFLLAVGTNQHE